MLLPAQRSRAERDAMVLAAAFRCRQATLEAEHGERRAVGLAALGRGLEGEVQHPTRRLDRREWARVHLAEHDRAQRMRGEPRLLGFADPQIRAHACPGDTRDAH